MLSGLYRIGSRLMLETQRQELIAQNLAGAGLAGFKARHLTTTTFRQELSQRGDGTGSGLTTVDVGSPLLDVTQGNLRHTNRALDMALDGPGFFEVETKDGSKLLTRNGNFVLSPTGTIVTQEGFAVQGASGPIRLDAADDPTRIELTKQGELLVPDPLGTGMRTVGKLRTVTVADPNRLLRLSANYYRPTPDQKPEPTTGDTLVCNGYQEDSNVSPVQEMAAMIQSLREFESGHKMVQTLTELARDENQKLS